MRNKSGWWIVVIIMVLLDLYVFQVVKFITNEASEKTRLIVSVIYWMVSVASIGIMIMLPYMNYETWPKSARTYFFAIVVIIFFAKIVAALFFLIDDFRRGLLWLMGKVFPTVGARFVDDSGLISRSSFLSWMGVGVGAVLSGSLFYGFTNKYDYHVRKIKLSFPNLPVAFKGFKIVQVSDIHSGSFADKNSVNKGVDKVLKEKPDVILFTGDLVNDRATEMKDYTDVFSRFSAPMGVFSILGNHDYGDYVNWESEEAKTKNLDDLKEVHKKMGWRLLLNEHVSLEKNGEQIALLGIENWSSKARFPKYGKMDLAYAGSEKYPFKILMSHDPSHWDSQVRTEYPDIDLMLSGHTHGMQFGLENPYFKWSPVQWVYKQWAGLYEQGKQKLYINRGFGFIGYPGRVGILPEITVIEFV